MWYDIAYIYIRINGVIYEGWTKKRYFPSILYNDIIKLVKHFEDNSITRLKQLEDCMLLLLESINY